MSPESQTESKRIKYTAKIRRGLGHLQEIVDSAFDDSKAPAPTLVKSWTAKKQAEFNAAKDWIDQELLRDAKDEPAAPEGGTFAMTTLDRGSILDRVKRDAEEGGAA